MRPGSTTSRPTSTSGISFASATRDDAHPHRQRFAERRPGAARRRRWHVLVVVPATDNTGVPPSFGPCDRGVFPSNPPTDQVGRRAAAIARGRRDRPGSIRRRAGRVYHGRLQSDRPHFPPTARPYIYYNGTLQGHLPSSLCLLLGRPEQVANTPGYDADLVDGNSLWVAITPPAGPWRPKTEPIRPPRRPPVRGHSSSATDRHPRRRQHHHQPGRRLSCSAASVRRIFCLPLPLRERGPRANPSPCQGEGRERVGLLL